MRPTKKGKQPKFKESRNERKQPHKYYYIDDDHRFAAEGGRCIQCNKVTDAFCDKCSKWICENHLVKPDKESYECFCKNCSD